MARYRVTMRVVPDAACPPRTGPPGFRARRVVGARCAEAAACEFAEPYVAAGFVVDWSVRRAGLLGLGRRWSGRFTPGDDDGLSGVREPRRPRPSAGSAAVALDLPAA